jgi:hypothetical protein
MRIQLSKIKLAVGILLALTFTFGCRSSKPTADGQEEEKLRVASEKMQEKIERMEANQNLKK